MEAKEAAPLIIQPAPVYLELIQDISTSLPTVRN